MQSEKQRIRISNFVKPFRRKLRIEQLRMADKRRSEFHRIAQAYGLTDRHNLKSKNYSAVTEATETHGIRYYHLYIPQEFSIASNFNHYGGRITRLQVVQMHRDIRQAMKRYQYADSIERFAARICDKIEISSIPRVPVAEIRSMPVVSVVYFLFDHSGAVHYVGASNNAIGRWRSHGKYHGCTSAIGWIEVQDYETSVPIEAHFIRELRPPNNKCCNPDWVSPKNKQRATA